MKTLILIATLLTSNWALAQRNTTTRPAATPSTSYSSSRDSEIAGNLGFTMGAPNLGVHYTAMNGSYHGWGGYFFYQTKKEKNSVPVVSDVMSFGGFAKVYLTDRSGAFNAYIAPGVGMTMVKDVVTDTTTGKKSDKTIFGPIMKMAAQVRATPQFAIGIERTAIANWFDDEAAASIEYWSVVGTFEM